MIYRSSLLACVLLVLSVVQAVKFQLPSERHPKPKWYVFLSTALSSRNLRGDIKIERLTDSIWNFAPKHSLVIVTANSPYEPGQRIDIEILDTEHGGNVYLSKKDIRGETRLAITTHESADVGVCLMNHYEAGRGEQSREVDLDIEIGADAVDYNAIANQESLSILEVEMRKLEAVTKEIVDELGYLQRREMRMRDTNESTNDRVKTFSILIMVGIIGLGAWQYSYRIMQRTHPTSPHPSDGQHHPSPTPDQHQDHHQNQNQNQGQVNSNSFPSLDNHSQQNHQQYDQEGGEGQEDIEQYSDAPPPSSQLVKYGTNLPRLPQSTTGLIVDRVISLPPQNSFPPQQQRDLYQHQQQGNDQRFEIPAYRPSSEHQRQQQQASNTSPRSNASLPVQTPMKNLFARPPSNPSPQISSSPLQTPNRPSDPVSRLTTDPVATNRMKQNTTSEGTAYALPPPNGEKVLVKRASKGVNGGFKVPWMASPGQEKENKVDQGGSKDVGEDKGGGQQGKTATPTRAPSFEEQQVVQMLSAQRVAAKKRAEAVQEGLLKTTPTPPVNQPIQQTSQSQDQGRPQPPKSNSKVNQSNDSPQDQPRTRKSTGQGEKVSSENDQISRPAQNQDDLQNPVPQPQPKQQGGISRSSNEQTSRQQGHRGSPSDQTNHQQVNRRLPQVQPVVQQTSRKSPNEQLVAQQVTRRSPNQQPSEGKPRRTRVSPNNGQPPVEQSVPLSPQENQGQHRGQTRNQDHSQDRDQELNDDIDPYDNQPTRGRGRAPGSSPTPHYQKPMPEYMGQRQNNQGPTQGQNDQSEDIRSHDYAYQDHDIDKPPARTPVHVRGQGQSQARSQGSKRSRQDQDEGQSEEQGQEDVFSIQGQVSKRQKNEVPPPSPEVQMEPEEQQVEAEEVPQFDAFSEIEKYDYVKDLQEPWNEMMGEMVPFIDGWAEKYLSTTLDTIYSVYGCYCNMSAQNAASLEAGVEDILEYQDTQNEIRQTLVDFRNGVAQISQRLVTKPEGSRGGTPQGGR